MLDIKLIREQPDFVRQRLAARAGGDDARIDDLLALDDRRRKLLAEVEALKAQRNRVSKEIGALVAQKKAAEAEAKKAETREIGEKINGLDRAVAEAEKARDEILLRLPNLPHRSVGIGRTSADNPEVRSWGAKPEFGFKPKSHIEICEDLKLVDFARGARLTRLRSAAM